MRYEGSARDAEPKDINTAYKTFQHQHPRDRPSEHETTNDGSTKQEEPTPSAEGWTHPTILLLVTRSRGGPATKRCGDTHR